MTPSDEIRGAHLKSVMRVIAAILAFVAAASALEVSVDGAWLKEKALVSPREGDMLPT